MDFTSWLIWLSSYILDNSDHDSKMIIITISVTITIGLLYIKMFIKTSNIQRVKQLKGEDKTKFITTNMIMLVFIFIPIYTIVLLGVTLGMDMLNSLQDMGPRAFIISLFIYGGLYYLLIEKERDE